MSLYCRLSQFDTDTWNIHHCLERTFLEQELIYLSCYSDKAMGWTTRESEFDSMQGKEILFSLMMSGLVVQPTEPHTQRMQGEVFLQG
jgi:hypothetical protein